MKVEWDNDIAEAAEDSSSPGESASFDQEDFSDKKIAAQPGVQRRWRAEAGTKNSETAYLEEWQQKVGDHVDGQLHGEGDGEEVLERVEGGDGLRADVSVGQLRLEDVGEEAEEDEDGDQGLRREAAVRRSQAVLGLADEPWPRLLEQDGFLRGVANHLDPGAAVLYSLRIKKISPAAVK